MYLYVCMYINLYININSVQKSIRHQPRETHFLTKIKKIKNSKHSPTQGYNYKT